MTAKINPNDIATLENIEHEHDWKVCSEGDWFCGTCGAAMSEQVKLDPEVFALHHELESLKKDGAK